MPMMKMMTSMLSGLAIVALLTMMPGKAQARFYNAATPNAASLVEQAACRTVKTRTRVGGRVVVKTVRRCTPSATTRYRSARRCTNVRTRVRTPAGTFVYRTVRRCR
jgi:cytochrome c-type biogenesis protein CcmE